MPGIRAWKVKASLLRASHRIVDSLAGPPRQCGEYAQTVVVGYLSCAQEPGQAVRQMPMDYRT